MKVAKKLLRLTNRTPYVFQRLRVNASIRFIHFINVHVFIIIFLRFNIIFNLRGNDILVLIL